MSLLREPDAEPIPGYRLIEPLGSGGFGEVWKCTAPGGLFKAIKFVFGNLNSLEADAGRAEQEFKALERIKSVRHAFILPMDRIENCGGELIIVMEMADKSLHDLCQENIAAGLVGIPRDELIRYIRDAADGLDWMSEKHRLQHLDIKPRNLFIVADRVKVADFGLVKAFERSGVSGIGAGVTPLYAPPETFTGKIDRNSDQYSLAIVYQELLTGQRPFNGRNARQLASQHMNDEPDLRTLPEVERPIVARALSKDPARRFPSCMAFVGALYHARSPARLSSVMEVPHESARPKNMADTMEDIQLGQFAAAPDEMLEAVNLGATPHTESEDELSKLGVTIAQPDTGSLRPTLIIGVGSFGKRALLELRCRLLDRFGDLSKLPLLQFAYVDTDPNAVKSAERGAPEVSLQRHEVAPLPLHPFGYYRRRQLDQLGEWLPREKLYSIPRSLRTQGSRALGRLAFADKYLGLVGVLRRQLLAACHPDALYRTVSETGLALRDATPRVYVVACASGGGSGYLTDLGYCIRRLLKQLRHADAPITNLLFCGAPEDPATPATELANLYATLTELNHFSDPALPFTAQYGADGPRIKEEGPPFDQNYVLTLPHRTPEGRRDVLLHVGSYLFHELTTPLGLRLDRCRMRKPHGQMTAFRTFGTYGVWFPRGLLLRAAGRAASIKLLEQWQSTEAPLAMPELEAAQARILSDPGLTPEALSTRVADFVAANLEGTPSDLLTQLLTAVEEQSKQSVAHDDPGAWARHALQRVQDWLGSGVGQATGGTVYQRKSRLTRALEAAAEQLAIYWDERFREAAFGLMEHPGRRVAVGEAALAGLEKFCQDACTAHAVRVQALTLKTRQAQEQLQGALENCLTGGGFSWFGGGTRRALRVFVDYLSAFARQGMAEDLAAASGLVYAQLRGRLAERARDLTFCRQRLRHMQEELETLADSVDEMGDLNSELSPSPMLAESAEAYWDSVRNSSTARLVLPENEEDLDRAARKFLQTLGPDQWGQLDQAFGDQVLAVRGGLYKALSSSNNQRHLATPLLNQAVMVLGHHLPITDVAQVEFSLGNTAEGDVLARMKSYYAQASPLAGAASGVAAGRSGETARPTGEPPEGEHTFLLVPNSEAGREYGEQAAAELHGVHLVKVPGQADLMFCREMEGLSAEELERVLRPCRAAYEEAANVPATSPHSRFDIGDWVPLDP